MSRISNFALASRSVSSEAIIAASEPGVAGSSVESVAAAASAATARGGGRAAARASAADDEAARCGGSAVVDATAVLLAFAVVRAPAPTDATHVNFASRLSGGALAAAPSATGATKLPSKIVLARTPSGRAATTALVFFIFPALHATRLARSLHCGAFSSSGSSKLFLDERSGWRIACHTTDFHADETLAPSIDSTSPLRSSGSTVGCGAPSARVGVGVGSCAAQGMARSTGTHTGATAGATAVTGIGHGAASAGSIELVAAADAAAIGTNGGVGGVRERGTGGGMLAVGADLAADIGIGTGIGTSGGPSVDTGVETGVNTGTGAGVGVGTIARATCGGSMRARFSLCGDEGSAAADCAPVAGCSSLCGEATRRLRFLRGDVAAFASASGAASVAIAAGTAGTAMSGTATAHELTFGVSSFAALALGEDSAEDKSETVRVNFTAAFSTAAV